MFRRHQVCIFRNQDYVLKNQVYLCGTQNCVSTKNQLSTNLNELDRTRLVRGFWSKRSPVRFSVSLTSVSTFL